MREIKTIGLDEALVGINAMREEAEKSPGRPMALAVSNAIGHIICIHVMDGASDFLREMVMKKCYTAAQLGDTTRATRDAIKSSGMSMGGDFCHSYATAVPGGIPIVPPGTERDAIPKDKDKKGGVQMARGQIGACGAGGRASFEDEEIAYVGARAIQKLVWGESSK